MPDPKHNPLIGVFRAPPEPAPPEAKPPAAPPKAEPAAAGKAAPDKQAPEAPKAPAAPPQAEPAAVGKAAPDKQTPEAPKAPVAPPKAEPATAGKAAPDKQTPEAPKAPTAPPKAEPAAGKPASEKKEPEPPKAPADGTAKAKPDKDAKPAGQANAAKDKKPGDTAKSQDGGASIVSQVPVDEIAENKLFSLDENDPSFKRLVEDIRKNGMREPINVNRTTDGKYEIIDGNRRLRAAKKLGLKTISTTIMNLPDKLKAKGQINSNLETHDLGGPEGDGDKGGDKGPSGPEQPGGGKEAPKPRFVALSHIKPLPGTYIKDEPRKDYSDLIADIKKHGLKKPVILRQSEKEGEFQLVDGFHRCKAMEQAGMLEVRADVYEMTLAQANDYRKGHREKPDLPIPGKLAPYPPEEPAKAQKAPEPPAAEEGEELPRDFQIPLTKEGQPETVTSLPIGVIKPFEGHPF